MSMKQSFILMVFVLMTMFANAQEPLSAQKGVTYGAGANAEGELVSADLLSSRLQKDKYVGKVTGKVVEVCQEKGCWMKLQKTDGASVMVKFKDYKFFMPKDIVGKEVVLDGQAVVKDVSVEQLKYLAKDAGKSEGEIEKIKEPKREIQFIAAGVLVR
jgi:hypothetical protein